MEYEHLARGLKTALLRDPHALDAASLTTVTNETVASWFHPFEPPQLDERRRKVREVGEVLQHFFDGLALNLIKQAEFSAVEAIRLVLANFPGGLLFYCYKNLGSLLMVLRRRFPRSCRLQGRAGALLQARADLGGRRVGCVWSPFFWCCFIPRYRQTDDVR